MASPDPAEPPAAKAPEPPWADPPLWEPSGSETQELYIFFFWRRKALPKNNKRHLSH